VCVCICIYVCIYTYNIYIYIHTPHTIHTRTTYIHTYIALTHMLHLFLVMQVTFIKRRTEARLNQPSQVRTCKCTCEQMIYIHVLKGSLDVCSSSFQYLFTVLHAFFPSLFFSRALLCGQIFYTAKVVPSTPERRDALQARNTFFAQDVPERVMQHMQVRQQHVLYHFFHQCRVSAIP
jgi:hypothetical protein